MPDARRLLALVCLLAGCSGTAHGADAQVDGATMDTGASSDVPTPIDVADEAADAPGADAADARTTDADAHAPPACTTRVYYGDEWIHAPGHPAQYDDVDGMITWDGACADDGAGAAHAALSNGWMPSFAGHGACVMDLEYSAGCAAAPTACTTRVTYGAAWTRPAGHAASFDDAAGLVLWSGECASSGGSSSTTLSNGWAPAFSGATGCELSLRYEQCGPLYRNAVVAAQCPDPGVLRDGTQYVMACTSGGSPDAYPIRTSSDLVSWTARGFVFPSGHWPTWASGDFWAPEIHRVGAGYVAYFSARARSDGQLSIGAATASSALGPFTDIGHPLIHDPSSGLIDVTEFETSAGERYVIWKVDGNATRQPTPIHIQRLAADGVSVTGAISTLITNDQRWEGGVVEGPWMIERGGMYYLFYSGSNYASTAYALGVARGASLTAMMAKPAGPLVTSNGAWSGPGHGSVVVGPGGEDVFVYHAWVAGHVGDPNPREVLVDRMAWGADGWPTMFQAPSFRSQPLP